MNKKKLWLLSLLTLMLVTLFACNNQGIGPANATQNQAANLQKTNGITASSANKARNGIMMTDSMQSNFRAHLDGRNEVPMVNTQGEGEAIFHISKSGMAISYKLIVSNINNVFMAHIHMGPATANGPIVVWLYPEDGPPSKLIKGRFNGVLAQGTITAKNLTGPLAGDKLSSLIKILKDGDAYVQVHTLQHKKGEIRGQIMSGHGNSMMMDINDGNMHSVLPPMR